MTDTPSPQAQFRKYIRPYAWALALSLFLVAVVGVLEAVFAFLIGLVVDMLGQSDASTVAIPFLRNLNLDVSAEYGVWILVILVISAILKAGAGYGSIAFTAYFGHSVVRALRTDLYHSIVSKPLGFFEDHPTGELISRVSSDVEKVQIAASETLADFLKQGAILVFLLIAVFVIDWKLAVMSLVLVPLVFYPAVWFGRRLRSLGRSNQQEMAGMANILFETFSGNRIVKIFTMERVELGKFREAADRVFLLSLRQRLTHALSSPLMEVLGIFVVAALLFYARNEIQAERMSVGNLVTFIWAMTRLYDSIRRMSGINNSFQQAIGSSAKLFEIMGSGREPDLGRLAFEEFRHSIDFRDVGFSYRGDGATLDGISFSLPRGEVLALVGSSGVGKTTLVNLLPRFYDVSSGVVEIDGVDVRDLTLRSLRGNIAMVTQDVILFNDTIRTNISYGSPDAGEAAILAASKAALAHDFVSSLPRGYDTIIGERGLRLSGGERQRISIARALLKDAPILILDEATSSLDAESESLVQQALGNLMQGRTTIVIAHRLSTVRRADRILLLSDGRIREDGSHEKLVLRKGLYWKLHKLQFHDAGEGKSPKSEVRSPRSG